MTESFTDGVSLLNRGRAIKAIDLCQAGSGDDQASITWDQASNSFKLLNALAAGITSQSVSLTPDFTTASAAFVDVTGMTVTLPNRSGRKGIVYFIVNCNSSLAGKNIQLKLLDNVTSTPIQNLSPPASVNQSVVIAWVTSLSGQVVKLQANISGGATLTVFGTAGTAQSYIQTMEF